jgi:hypothetical protein
MLSFLYFNFEIKLRPKNEQSVLVLSNDLVSKSYMEEFLLNVIEITVEVGKLCPFRKKNSKIFRYVRDDIQIIYLC